MKVRTLPRMGESSRPKAGLPCVAVHCTLNSLCSCVCRPGLSPLQPEHGHLFSCVCISLQSLLFPDILKTSPEPPCPEDYPSLKR